MNDNIIEAVGKLEALRFFPTTENGRIAIMELLSRMVSTPVQLEWFVRTMIDRVGTYQGTDQLRAVFCTRFKPADGIEANVSPEFPLYRSEEECEFQEKLRAGGTEPERPAIGEGYAVRQISAPAEPITPEEAERNREFAASLVRPLCIVVEMPASKPTLGPITQTDVDHAKAEYLKEQVERKAGRG